MTADFARLVGAFLVAAGLIGLALPLLPGWGKR